MAPRSSERPLLSGAPPIGISSGSDGSFSLQIPPPLPPGNWKLKLIWAMRLWWSMWVTVLLSTLRFRSRPPKIEQVVVTALGIKRSEKAVAYNVQQIKAEDITTVKDANFINSSTGKSGRCHDQRLIVRCRRCLEGRTARQQVHFAVFERPLRYRRHSDVQLRWWWRYGVRFCAVLRNPSQTSTPRILSRCRC